MANTIKSRRSAKLRIIKHYSPTMSCPCGETDFNKLTIDHIKEGEGNIDRRVNGTSSGGCYNPHRFYMSIIKRGYPSIYQILCKKCNWDKNEKYLFSKNNKYKIRIYMEK